MTSLTLLHASPSTISDGPSPWSTPSQMSFEHLSPTFSDINEEYGSILTGKPMSFFRNQQLKSPQKENNSQEKSSLKQLPKNPSKEENANHSLKVRFKLHNACEKKNSIRDSSCGGNCLNTKSLPSHDVTNVETIHPSSQKKRLSLGRIPKTAFCYTCGNVVKENLFSQHLFYGELECTKCNKILYTCKQFADDKMDYAMNYTTCSHAYQFRTEMPSEYLTIRLMDDPFSDSSLKSDIQRKILCYIKSLEPLKEKEPWKKAIEQCQLFIKDEHLQEVAIIAENSDDDIIYSLPGEKNNKPSKIQDCVSQANQDSGEFPLSQSCNFDNINAAIEYEVVREDPNNERDIDCARPSDEEGNQGVQNLKKTFKKKKRGIKRKYSFGHPQRIINNNTQGFLEIPANGYYLILRHVIEECPMCYTKLCPSRFTLNVKTFLLTTICIGCDLTIYIIRDPPDGFPPRICIVTETEPSVNGNDTSEEQNTKEKKQIRATDFFMK